MMLDRKGSDLSPSDASVCDGSMRAPESKPLAELALVARMLEEPTENAGHVGPTYLKNGKVMNNFLNPSPVGGILESDKGSQFICMKGCFRDWIHFLLLSPLFLFV